MKIAIIGAGAAGLAAIKHAIDYDFFCEAFEQTDKIGGTWNYTDLVGVDENDLPVHSSMYKGLKTNIPKEVMEYEDFHYPKEQTMSYISQQEVLDYINNYAEHHNLKKHIKFHKYVTKIAPTNNNQWEITVVDAKTKRTDTYIYDAVMVCNGHYRDPIIPSIKGRERFIGRQWHSHDYRSPETFTDKTVVVLGAGPSGRDIAGQIATVAKKVYLSHNDFDAMLQLPENIVQKPVIAELVDDGVIFEDNSKEFVDEILYCTGYRFNFPFLTEDCGITVENNWVKPLYKHCININNPKMCFIGIPFTICPFPMFDLQVKFFLSTLTGHFSLPSREEMLRDLHSDVEERESIGMPRRHAHKVGEDQEKYFNDLADTANLKRVPAVIHRLYLYVRENRNLTDCYEIIDDDTFIIK